MPVGQAATTQQLQLEALNDIIKLLIEEESLLDKRISERGSITPVSLRSFRVRFQTAFPGNVALFNLDGGIIPTGSFSAWDQGTITPLAWIIPVEYSRLTDIIGEGGPKVVSENPVDKTLADVAKQMALQRDQFLQQSGDGHIATVDSTYAGGGANPILIAAAPVLQGNVGGAFGARLISQGQQVQVMSPSYALRGVCVVTNVSKKLGTHQSITVDSVPVGTVAGDFIMVAGVAAVTPVFVLGIPYFHNTSTAGNYLGISRANSYVVANGVNINNAQVSLPAFRASMTRVENSLGASALKTQVWHTQPSAVQAYEEIGFAKQWLGMSQGKMPGFDGLSATDELRIEGREIIRNIHADQTRWDFMDFGSWLKVVWGKTPQWFRNRSGQWVFQVYDPSSGNPTANELCAYYDARQYAVDNPQAISSVTSTKIPVFN
jgi:hypothetical protein